MPVVPRSRLLLTAVLAVATFALLPDVASAQSADPCLDSLDPAGVEQYEQLVDTYYTAQEDGDFDGQLTALDSLAAICDSNLRLGVLRGDALIGLDRCEDAATEYFRVLDAVPDWPFPDNAADARFMATEALRIIRDECVAQVEVSCSPATAMVAVGSRTPEPCGSVFAVPARTTTVSAYADGHETVSREFSARAGNNFIDLGALPAGEGTTTPPVTDTTPDPQPEAAGANEGTLMVSCAPADATVRIESPALAQPRSLPCPVSTPLPEGAYQLTVAAEGHESTTREINVRRADVSRMAVELQQPGGDKIGISLRLLGGVAFGSTNEVEEQDDGTEVDAEARRHGNLRLAIMTGIGGDATDFFEFEFGAWLRTLFPFEDAADTLFAGAVTGSYVMRLGIVGILLGGHLGYGTIGSYDDDAADDEQYAASIIYGFGGGLHVPIGSSIEVLATVDLLLGTDSTNSGELPLAVDILGGVGWRF